MCESRLKSNEIQCCASVNNSPGHGKAVGRSEMRQSQGQADMKWSRLVLVRYNSSRDITNISLRYSSSPSPPAGRSPGTSSSGRTTWARRSWSSGTPSRATSTGRLGKETPRVRWSTSSQRPDTTTRGDRQNILEVVEMNKLYSRQIFLLLVLSTVSDLPSFF